MGVAMLTSRINLQVTPYHQKSWSAQDRSFSAGTNCALADEDAGGTVVRRFNHQLNKHCIKFENIL